MRRANKYATEGWSGAGVERSCGRSYIMHGVGRGKMFSCRRSESVSVANPALPTGITCLNLGLRTLLTNAEGDHRGIIPNLQAEASLRSLKKFIFNCGRRVAWRRVEADYDANARLTNVLHEVTHTRYVLIGFAQPKILHSSYFYPPRFKAPITFIVVHELLLFATRWVR